MRGLPFPCAHLKTAASDAQKQQQHQRGKQHKERYDAGQCGPAPSTPIHGVQHRYSPLPRRASHNQHSESVSDGGSDGEARRSNFAGSEGAGSEAEPSGGSDKRARKTAPWTRIEDEVIGEGVSRFGCRWGMLTALLPGRTCASVRNRWHRLKHARLSREGNAGAQEERGAGCSVETAAVTAAIGLNLSLATPACSATPASARPSADCSGPRNRSAGREAAQVCAVRVVDAGDGTAERAHDALRSAPLLSAVADGEHAGVASETAGAAHRTSGSRRSSGASAGACGGSLGYKCSRCGQPKRGHLCTSNRSEDDQAAYDAAQLRMRSLLLQQVCELRSNPLSLLL